MRVWSRSRRLAAVVGAALTAAALFFGGTAAEASTAPPLPHSMAAIGDSISQASTTCWLLYACPQNSWSTGWSSAVDSQASRLRAQGARLLAFDDAVPGATSADMAQQAGWAVDEHAQYVTVEVGANDACASTVAGMTPVATYRQNVQDALRTLAGSPEHPQIFVASIPNLQQLWTVEHTNPRAQLAWSLLGECNDVLARTATDADRAAVQTQIGLYDSALSQVCAATPNCRYDGGAVTNAPFTSADISTVDYFHPSLAGQHELAAVTWGQTVWAH